MPLHDVVVLLAVRADVADGAAETRRQNEYADRGLRMIEIYKHQFGLLSQVIAKIKNRNYRFMIFIDVFVV